MRALCPIFVSLCLLVSPEIARAVTKTGSGGLVISTVGTVSNVAIGDVPVILASRGRNVTVQVPVGYDQITIERRTARRLQPWVTEKVAVCSPAGGEVVVRLRVPRAKRVLRVVGRKATVVNPDTGRLVTFYGLTGSSGLTIDGGISGTSFSFGNTTNVDPTVTTAPREVVESDLWKLSGDRLYVFNPYRGLQVVDVSDPADPALMGGVNLHANGDSLYLAGPNHVALLTNSTSNFTWNQAPLTVAGSLVVCDVSGTTPVAVANLQLEGFPLESRLVGSALYVVTDNSGAGSWGSRRNLQVTGYDLQNPAQPVKRNTLTIQVAAADLSSHFGAVQASDEYFVVAQHLYRRGLQYRTRLHLVDISDPSGTVQLRGNILSDGYVADKFKIQHHGEVLSAIADIRNAGTARVTRLENFSVANPNQITKIGHLDVGLGESVRGTRFDGDRVYIVTFFQIDPLWLVDNSDPTKPRVGGHLDVPGFSTFLQPLGDRLVTVGFLNQGLAVSLFDVSNTSEPKLLTQLPIGAPWASSEATWDEQAFTVLPDAGLIMLPVSSGWGSWSSSYWHSQGVIQLVDLKRDTLTLRGKIDHGFTPRRATVHRDAVIALGNASLLTADITDRDAPKVLADVELAWRTDYAWRLGNHLVQVGGSIDGTVSTIAISPADQPDVMLSTLELGPERVVAADMRGGYLYVLRRREMFYGSYLVFHASDGTTSTSTDPLILTVHDVSSLPQIVKKAELSVPNLPATAEAKLHWPDPGTLVLSFTQHSGWGSIGLLGDFETVRLVPATTGTTAATTVAGSTLSLDQTSSLTMAQTSTLSLGQPSVIFPPFYGAPSKHFAAFDVRAADVPSFIALSTVAPKWYSTFSEVFESAGKLFVSRQVGWDVTTLAFATTATTSANSTTAPTPDTEFQPGRNFLHVIDYSDPAVPTARPGISAPGVLEGVARNGTVLYTNGLAFDLDGHPKSDTCSLHASIYDGTKLELAATLLIETSFQAVTLEDLICVQTTKMDPALGKLRAYTQVWELEPNLEFTFQDEVPFYGYTPRAVDGVLFTQSYAYWGSAFLGALDLSNPTDLRDLGQLSVGRFSPGLFGLSGDRANGFLLPQGEQGVIQFRLPEDAAE